MLPGRRVECCASSRPPRLGTPGSARPALVFPALSVVLLAGTALDRRMRPRQSTAALRSGRSGSSKAPGTTRTRSAPPNSPRRDQLPRRTRPCLGTAGVGPALVLGCNGSERLDDGKRGFSRWTIWERLHPIAGFAADQCCWSSGAGAPRPELGRSHLCESARAARRRHQVGSTATDRASACFWRTGGDWAMGATHLASARRQSSALVRSRCSRPFRSDDLPRGGHECRIGAVGEVSGLERVWPWTNAR